MLNYLTEAEISTYAGINDVGVDTAALANTASRILEGPQGANRSLFRAAVVDDDDAAGATVETVRARPMEEYAGVSISVLPRARGPGLPFVWVKLEGRPVGGGLYPTLLSLPTWVEITTSTVELDRVTGRLLVPANYYYGPYVEIRATYHVGWQAQADVTEDAKVACGLIAKRINQAGAGVYMTSISDRGIGFGSRGMPLVPDEARQILDAYRPAGS